MQGKRLDRVNQLIKEEISTLLQRELKDPRLGFVTVTDARVTGDLHDATVFYTVYGDDAARADTAVALDSVKGLLRSEVGRQTGVRFTPTLTFVADAVPENAAHIDDLLRKALQDLQHPAGVAQVEQRRGFVAHQDPWFGHEHRAQCQQLLLTAREQVGGVVGEDLEADGGHRREDAPSGLLRAQSAAA